MSKRKERRDLPDENEISVRPLVWLQWYEHHLRQVLKDWAQRRKVEREDLELLLFDRSDLERALKAAPEGLTAAERRKLAVLDNELKKLASAICAALPDLPAMRRQLGVPKSHWWWFLDKMSQEQIRNHPSML